jgi:hypothetical protein
LDIELAIRQAVNNTSGSDATFYAFLDGNRDGDFDDPGEVQSTVVPGDGSVIEVTEEFAFTIPWPGVLDWQESFALRCRISSDPNLGPNGPAPDGEVQDDIITIEFSIDSPRLNIIEGPELFLLDGNDVVAALDTPLTISPSDIAPASVGQIINPLWSLLLQGNVTSAAALNLSAADINGLGLGSHPVTLTFSDPLVGEDYAIRFFLRIVDLPGYAAWATDNGLGNNIGRPEYDADGDGASNLLEYALGSQPDIPNSIPLSSATLTGTGVPSYLRMSYPRLNGGSLTAEGYRVGELLYQEQGSLDLVNWEEVVSTTANPGGLPLAPVDHQWASFRLASPTSSQNQGFLRVQVDLSCDEHP